MSKLTYLLDECVPEFLQDELIRLEPAIEIVQVGQEGAPPKGTKDRELLLFAEAHRQTLVSRDKRTLPGHLAAHFRSGHHTRGLCLLVPDHSTVEYAEDLVLVWSCHELEDMLDFMAYFPL